MGPTSTGRPVKPDLAAKQDEASGSPRSLQLQRSKSSAHHQEDGLPDLNFKDISRGRPETTGRVAGKTRASLSRSRSITVTNLIKVITKIQDHGYEQYPGTEIRAQSKLDPLGYEKFLERLDQPKNQDLRDYINDELRVEYSPDEKELTILMPTDIHDGLGTEIVGSILKKFFLLGQAQNCDNRQLVDLAEQIEPHGTSKLAFNGTRARREPDGSFVHRGCTKQRGPTWVIEVNWTYSKTRQEFAKRAKELIRLSKGEIRTVVNVDLGEIYRAGLKDGVKTGGPAPALLSVWRPRLDSSAGGGESGLTAYADPEEMIFRDACGKAVESAALRLSLADFICRDCAASHPGSEDTMIFISSGELCRRYENNMEDYRATVDREAQGSRLDGSDTIAAPNEEQAATTQSLATPPAEEPPPQEPPQREPRPRRHKWIPGFKGSYKGMQSSK